MFRNTLISLATCLLLAGNAWGGVHVGNGATVDGVTVYVGNGSTADAVDVYVGNGTTTDCITCSSDTTPIFYWDAESLTSSTAGSNMTGGTTGTFVSACEGNGYNSYDNASTGDVGVPVTNSDMFNLEVGTFVGCITPVTFLTTLNYIFGYGDGSNSIRLSIQSTGRLYAIVERSNIPVSVQSAEGSTVSTGTAYDIRMTWAADGTFYVYVDGVEFMSGQNTNTFVDVPTDTLVIGGDHVGGDRLHAEYDEIYFYNEVITP